MADDNRGNYGDPEEHAKAGSMSSGNQGNPQQHPEAGQKGGKAAQESENIHGLTDEERSRGGQNSSRSPDDLDEI